MNGLSINCHSSIRIVSDKVIYFDPFQIEENLNDADVIFFTHDHYDHVSEDAIKKVIKKDTILIGPKTCEEKIKSIANNEFIDVLPNKSYSIFNINFETIPAYNTNKAFHPKENNWVGYIIDVDGLRYYIAGDTDITLESLKVNCDVALVPIGGTYTMTYEEAAKLINEIKPRIVIPTHYGSIVGDKVDGLKFKELIDSDIKCIVLM